MTEGLHASCIMFENRGAYVYKGMSKKYFQKQRGNFGFQLLKLNKGVISFYYIVTEPWLNNRLFISKISLFNIWLIYLLGWI